MSDELHQLRIQHAALGEQIASAQTEAKAGAIAKVKAIMAEHGLTVADIAGNLASVKRASKPTGKVAPKYRDEATGNTWTGRGQTPRWLVEAFKNGKTADDFKIAA